jgi:hypothetical protein
LKTLLISFLETPYLSCSVVTINSQLLSSGKRNSLTYATFTAIRISSWETKSIPINFFSSIDDDIAMLAEMGLKRLLCIANVDVIADLVPYAESSCAD